MNNDCNATGLFAFYRSVDAGATFTLAGVVPSDVHALGFTIPQPAVGAAAARMRVYRATGTIYVLWATSAIQDTTQATFRLVVLGRSDDGGSSWRNFLVYAAPLGTSVLNLFPALAVDRSGSVYAAWSTTIDNGRYGIYVSHSTDRGEHWSAAQRVNATDQTAVFPAMVAGNAGNVDLVWLGTGAATPDAPDAQWNVFVAQSKNGTNAQPNWSVGQVTPQVMHRGDICRNGLNCDIFGGNRDLADFISVTIDTQGMANIVWTDDASQSSKAIMFGKQISGPGLGKSAPDA